MRKAIAASLTLALALAPSALAQLPRTPDGRPDLQGVWSSHFMTGLERPDGITGLVVAPADADKVLKKIMPKIPEVYDPEFNAHPFPEALLDVKGELRSSMLITPEDGKLPFTAIARANVEHFKRGFDNPEDRPGAERCTDSLNYPPLQIADDFIPHLFVQTPGAIVIATEDVDAGRIITLGAPAAPEPLRTLAGSSRGRWEGDTLIVETDHFAIADPRGFAWRGDALVTADSRVIERFSLLSANEMLYQFTIEDPSLYKAPWLAEYVMRRSTHQLYEYACHEGNYGMANILSAARLGRQEEKPKP
jgi:hypothetical protein